MSPKLAADATAGSAITAPASRLLAKRLRILKLI
jgi:hypothetical protein